MSRKRVDMHRLQELVRLHRMGTPPRKVARLLRMGPNTERRYRKALRRQGFLDGDPEDLPDVDSLMAVIRLAVPSKPAPQQTSSVQRWRPRVERMLAKGAGPTAIHDTLRTSEEEYKGSASAIKRMCLRIKKERGVQPQDVAIPVETGPGEVAQVDFGFAGKLYDPERGVLRKAWFFVMVLGFSRHQFVRIVFDQRAETWLQLHVEAFETFGGVVQTVVPDNLKAAVIRAAFGQSDRLELNRSYRELARHYGIQIDPTPPRAPQKKGKSESAVKYVKRNFLRPRDFDDIVDANAQLDHWVLEVAGKRIHGTTARRPLEVFEDEERAVLHPLPAQRFEPVVWKQAKVHRDGRFQFQQRTYPVPWRHLGKQVWIRATPHTLHVFLDEERIATHERGKPVPREIADAMLPPERAAYRHRSREYWIERADALGPEVGAYIREVFDADEVLSQLRAVQGMVTLLEKHPERRATAACRRAQYFGNHTYRGLRDILLKGLDLEPLPDERPVSLGRLDKPRFARPVQEILFDGGTS